MKQILNIFFKMERATSFMALINYKIEKWNEKSQFKSILNVKRNPLKSDQINFFNGSVSTKSNKVKKKNTWHLRLKMQHWWTQDIWWGLGSEWEVMVMEDQIWLFHICYHCSIFSTKQTYQFINHSKFRLC